MKFWDSSAIVPLLVNDQSSDSLMRLPQKDPNMIIWRGTKLECISALSRLGRDGSLEIESISEAVLCLTFLHSSWNEIEPVPSVRHVVRRLLRLHPLRTADSLQLAAAIVAAGHRRDTLDFVCKDKQLSNAAQKEGFRPKLSDFCRRIASISFSIATYDFPQRTRKVRLRKL